VRPNAHPRRPARTAALALLLLFAPGLAGAAGAQSAAGPGRDPETAGVPLTLEAAIAGALEKNEAILIERSALGAAAAAADGAAGAYDPVLGLDAGWRRRTAPVNSAFSGAPPGETAPTDEVAEAGASLRQLLPTGGAVAVRAGTARSETDGAFGLLSPAYDAVLGVELRQPLLRDRGIDPARLALRVTAADRDRATASLQREVVETVAAVERAYWALVAARREIGVREEAVELAGEQLEETGIRVEGGAAPETEVAQPRAELERRRGELLEAREAAARAENALKLLILDDADADLWAARLSPVADVEAEVVPVDVAAAMAAALAARPELAASAALVERRRAETAFARDGILPALDLVVSYDRFGLAGSRNPAAEPLPGQPADLPADLEGDLGSSLGQLADGDFDDARIALVFELPLGNRTARAEAEIARSAERQAEAALARARKAIRAEVLDAAAALETADGRIDAARAAREAAEVQLGAERERYAVGLSTNFLVLTRQNDLAGARLAEIEALTDYRAARVELARATGTLLEERGIEVNAAPEG
jgi:HAE1 family hydrophobic/amphiphilic exporter-1